MDAYLLCKAGIITLIVFVGIIFLIFAAINFVIRGKLKDINRLIRQVGYREAKDKELFWVILGFVLAGLIIGIIVLIAYTKYSDLIRSER
ncbi:MAG: hypothetical protein V5A68_07220 [Candidatus Thermoplasmatota archaeon]